MIVDFIMKRREFFSRDNFIYLLIYFEDSLFSTLKRKLRIKEGALKLRII